MPVFVMAIALTLACAVPVAAQDTLTNVIVVRGEAVVRRAPDLATITVAVETHAPSPRDAQRQNADRMAAVIKRMTDSGIVREALRTIGVRLDQEFDLANGRRTPKGFVARSTLEVTVADVSRAGEIADAAVQAGATAIDGIGFALKDRAAAEREALRLAVADAKARADAAASGAGRSIDRIVRIDDERAVEPPRPIPMARAGLAAAPMTADSVEPGVIEVRASVVLTASMR
jgi:uncharacterized protein YggE